MKYSDLSEVLRTVHIHDRQIEVFGAARMLFLQGKVAEGVIVVALSQKLKMLILNNSKGKGVRERRISRRKESGINACPVGASVFTFASLYPPSLLPPPQRTHSRFMCCDSVTMLMR